MKCISWWLCTIYCTLAIVINVRNEALIIAFGKRVREIRKSQGLTMEQLAGDAGIDARQLSYIELGQVNITISSIHAIAKALNKKISELTLLEDF